MFYTCPLSETRFSNGSTSSVCQSKTHLWCLVCVVCTPKVFILFYLNVAWLLLTYWRCAYSILCTFMNINLFLGVLSFRPKMLRWCLVCVICNSNRQFPFLYIQTLHNDCSNIGDAHLSSCAHLKNIFSFQTGVLLRHFCIQNAKGVSGLCKSVTTTVFIPLYSNFAKWLFTAPPILYVSHDFFPIVLAGGGGGGSDIFFCKILRGCLVCVICNSNSFHFVMLKLCKITVMDMYTLYVVHIW